MSSRAWPSRVSGGASKSAASTSTTSAMESTSRLTASPCSRTTMTTASWPAGRGGRPSRPRAGGAPQPPPGPAVRPHDDDDGVVAGRPRGAAEPLAQLDGGDHLAAQVDQPRHGRRGQRHPGQALALQHLLHVLDLDAVQVAVEPEGGQLPAGGGGGGGGGGGRGRPHARRA